MKIPHASFGFASGCFRTNQPTVARDHEAATSGLGAETGAGTDRGVADTSPVVGTRRAGSSNGGTEEPEVRIDGNCGSPTLKERHQN